MLSTAYLLLTLIALLERIFSEQLGSMIGRLAGGKAVSDYVVFLCPAADQPDTPKKDRKRPNTSDAALKYVSTCLGSESCSRQEVRKRLSRP